MFGFIKTALNAAKQSIYSAYVKVKEAIKSVYTKMQRLLMPSAMLRKSRMKQFLYYTPCNLQCVHVMN
jgi:hypothetical protein